MEEQSPGRSINDLQRAYEESQESVSLELATVWIAAWVYPSLSRIDVKRLEGVVGEDVHDLDYNRIATGFLAEKILSCGHFEIEISGIKSVE